MDAQAMEFPISILLVEDNEDDIIIVKKAFEKMKLRNEFAIARNGSEALDYVSCSGKFAALKPRKPGLILLDISMPGMDGFEVLKRLKENEETKAIPVIMLTTSGRPEDINKSFQSGAASYIVKPPDINEFIAAMQRFEIYWTLVSKIPK